MQLLWLRIPLLLGISFLRPPGPRIRSTSESHQINWLKNCREKNKSLVMTEPPCQQQFTVSVTMIFDLPNSFIFSISIFITFKTTVVLWFLCLTYIRKLPRPIEQGASEIPWFGLSEQHRDKHTQEPAQAGPHRGGKAKVPTGFLPESK